jgi:putative restriction endonuclease
VCQLQISPDAKSLVDAAHIVPFAVSHNDDPRNGLALCKNHHWGFDAGWFSASDDRRVVVSGRVAEVRAFVAADMPLLIPLAEGLGPAVEALRWHRRNVLLR